jgi:hypothetical protein
VSSRLIGCIDAVFDTALYLVRDAQGGKRVERRPFPALTTSPLDDDFDAITLPATSLAYVHEEDDGTSRTPLPERTFGGAVEMTVRALSTAPRRTDSTTFLSTTDSLPISPKPHQRRHSVADSQWESLGRRSRQPGQRGEGKRYKMVEHILEDNSERTISVWREEVARSSDDGDSSTLAGGTDEWGRFSEADSHWRRRTLPKGGSKYKASGKPFAPATANSMLGISEVSCDSGMSRRE